MEIVPEATWQGNLAVFDPGLSELTTALRRAVRARMRGNGPFARVEAEALALSNEAIRRLLQDELQQLADTEQSEMRIDGKLSRRHQPGTVQVHSLCGPISVTRWTGLIERATPARAKAIAR